MGTNRQIVAMMAYCLAHILITVVVVDDWILCGRIVRAYFLTVGIRGPETGKDWQTAW